MKYENIISAIFKSRPNRFIALCEVGGKTEICHVKNTGRCRELLTEGACVYLEESDKADRKTKYDLVAVMKNGKLFNIDSQAPNKAVYEWLKRGGMFPDTELVKPECKYKNSRFDFYVEHGERCAYVEVKGVTLEEDGVLLFPDAPTERGVKHIKELICAHEDGYEAYIIFVIQTGDAKYFTPNAKTHKEFADALIEAQKSGVNLLCYCCKTEPDIMEIDHPVPIVIDL